MLYYYLSYISCFVIGISKQRRNKICSLILISLLAIFLCGGYFCGSDWRSYEWMYYNVELDNLFYGYYAEPGYYLYMLLWRLLNVDFWHFTIITKLLCFLSFAYIANYYLRDRIWLALMYFIPWFGFYLFIDCPFRNLIAVSLFLIAIYYWAHEKKWKTIFLLILASTFHVSAVVFIPCLFFLKRRVSTKIWIFLFLLFNVFFADRFFLVNVINRLFGSIPYLSDKIQDYLLVDNEYAGGSMLSLGMIIQLVFFVLFVWKRTIIENTKDGNVIFNLSMLYFLFYRIALTIEVFSRFQLFVCLFLCISFILLLGAFSYNSRRLYLIYLLIIATFGTTKLFSDYRYIPYTNYITYMFNRTQPSFEYRSQYNFIHSPYK